MKQKSISVDHTFQEDIVGSKELFGILEELAETLFQRTTQAGFRTIGQVGITVRFSDFQTCTRQKTVDKPVDNSKMLYQGLLPLSMPFLDRRENMRKQSFRLLGVKAGKLN